MPIFAVEAFKLFIGETAPNPASAGVLGVLLILTTALVLLVQRRFLSARRFATNARQAPPILKVGRGLRASATLYCWTIVLLALVPFFAIVVLSFLEFRGPGAASAISAWPISPTLFDRALRPLANTLIFASAGGGLRHPGRRADRLCGDALPLRRRHAARRRGHPAVCRRRHRARHRLRRVVQQRHAGPDRRAADHGAGLHRAQGAVRRALGQRHRPPDRRLARGGLDQPRPLAACRPSCASSCR